MTFDCGYEVFITNPDGTQYAITGRILDVLKEKNAKGVFFVTGNYAKKNPDLVRRMIDEGHIVGNHTSKHPSMPSISIDEMVSQVMEVHEYMLEHFGYEMTLFRAPSGEYSVQSLAVVHNLGYKHVFWSFAYADYDPEDQPERDYAYDLITSNHHSGAIYLLHATSVINAEVLGDCIDFWRAEGYTIGLYS